MPNANYQPNAMKLPACSTAEDWQQQMICHPDEFTYPCLWIHFNPAWHGM